MDANPPTTGEYAYSMASENATSVQDCLVLIGFLAERITQLERLVHPDFRINIPELPSKMHGFACIPRREEVVRDAMSKVWA